ncbi:hypothetical protein [Amycolatopsis sp. DG1A-15b]|uniref:hypothetical protein n=1 Tax=Amycolatopsis sp. DG1A-15b TaxID=3052846 RepID=UPI00255B98A2|nr:hypothetical protein [Amycolatopsis sp. DG1A-15b]WIX92509.1 hypothetical protein QRY02_19545 [Amycolatopsis sp. DG1A-15b]
MTWFPRLLRVAFTAPRLELPAASLWIYAARFSLLGLLVVVFSLIGCMAYVAIILPVSVLFIAGGLLLLALMIWLLLIYLVLRAADGGESLAHLIVEISRRAILVHSGRPGRGEISQNAEPVSSDDEESRG